MPSSCLALQDEWVLETQRTRNGWVVWALSPKGSTVGSASVSDRDLKALVDGISSVTGQSLALRPRGKGVEVSLGQELSCVLSASELLQVFAAA